MTKTKTEPARLAATSGSLSTMARCYSARSQTMAEALLADPDIRDVNAALLALPEAKADVLRPLDGDLWGSYAADLAAHLTDHGTLPDDVVDQVHAGIVRMNTRGQLATTLDTVRDRLVTERDSLVLERVDDIRARLHVALCGVLDDVRDLGDVDPHRTADDALRDGDAERHATALRLAARYDDVRHGQAAIDRSLYQPLPRLWQYAKRAHGWATVFPAISIATAGGTLVGGEYGQTWRAEVPADALAGGLTEAHWMATTPGIDAWIPSGDDFDTYEAEMEEANDRVARARANHERVRDFLDLDVPAWANRATIH